MSELMSYIPGVGKPKSLSDYPSLLACKYVTAKLSLIVKSILSGLYEATSYQENKFKLRPITRGVASVNNIHPQARGQAATVENGDSCRFRTLD